MTTNSRKDFVETQDRSEGGGAMLPERTSFTSPDGRRTARVRLSPETVILARRSAKAGAGIVAMAKELGVDSATLHQAITGVTWAHLDYVEPPTKMSGLNRPIQQDIRGSGIVDVNLLPPHGMTRLDGRQVVEARRLLKKRPTMTMAAIIATLKLNVTSSTVAQAISGATWTHLNDVEPPVPGTTKQRRKHFRDSLRLQREQQRDEKRRSTMRQKLARVLSRKPTAANRVPASKAVEIIRSKRESRFDAYAEAFRLKLTIGEVYAVSRGDVWPELHELIEVL